jgi:hypothetical protein
VAQFTYGQLESLWIQAGGSRALAPLMAAIALAESGGNSDARNPSGASGLWQILGNPFPGNAFDPATNAKMAVAKYHEQGLTAWETYTSGAYKRFMRGNVAPAQAQTTAAVGGGDSSALQQWFTWIPGFGIPLSFMAGNASSVGDVANAIAEIGKVFSEVVTVTSWLFVPSHWIRIICFVLGVPAVLVGVTTMTVGARPIPISAYGVSTEISGGSIAPAIGIAEVTVGAVLLFIAFHNLPDEVRTFPELLGYMQGKVGAGAASKQGPGPGATLA